jgi:hypothetical protein
MNKNMFWIKIIQLGATRNWGQKYTTIIVGTHTKAYTVTPNRKDEKMEKCV